MTETFSIDNPKAFADYLRGKLNCGRIDYSDIIIKGDGVGQIKFDIHNMDGDKIHEVYLEHTGNYKIVKY